MAAQISPADGLKLLKKRIPTIQKRPTGDIPPYNNVSVDDSNQQQRRQQFEEVENTEPQQDVLYHEKRDERQPPPSRHHGIKSSGYGQVAASLPARRTTAKNPAATAAAKDMLTRKPEPSTSAAAPVAELQKRAAPTPVGPAPTKTRKPLGGTGAPASTTRIPGIKSRTLPAGAAKTARELETGDKTIYSTTSGSGTGGSGAGGGWLCGSLGGAGAGAGGDAKGAGGYSKLARRGSEGSTTSSMASSSRSKGNPSDPHARAFGGSGAAPLSKQKPISYALYNKLVGEADGGTQIPRHEYDELVRLYHESAKNKLRVCWVNNEEKECVRISTQCRCFCGHSYRAHAWYETETKQVNCRVPGCHCSCYNYINQKSSWSISCVCRHKAADHLHNGDLGVCKTCRSGSCAAFYSNYSCVCGKRWEEHRTRIENEQERAARGVVLDRDIVKKRCTDVKKKTTCGCMGCKNLMPCALIGLNKRR